MPPSFPRWLLVDGLVIKGRIYSVNVVGFFVSEWVFSLSASVFKSALVFFSVFLLFYSSLFFLFFFFLFGGGGGGGVGGRLHRFLNISGSFDLSVVQKGWENNGRRQRVCFLFCLGFVSCLFVYLFVCSFLYLFVTQYAMSFVIRPISGVNIVLRLFNQSINSIRLDVSQLLGEQAFRQPGGPAAHSNSSSLRLENRSVHLSVRGQDRYW